MNEILNMLNALKADELDKVIVCATIMLEKKRKEEEEEALREKERQRQEKILKEKRRQEEIAELERRLKELQNQAPAEPTKDDVVRGDNFVMHDEPNKQEPYRPTPSSAQSNAKQQTPVEPAAANQVKCPHCQRMNAAGSIFCESCGKRINEQSQPAQQSADQVRHINDESVKEWNMLPGETVVRNSHEVFLLQPDGGKFAYYMEVTNKRILFTRESSGAKNASLAARMGGGLLGSLIAEGIKAAAGSGPMPWLEIPLSAVSNCGRKDKKEFFITADQTYVLKNNGYEKFLPELVMKAKQGGM